MKVYVLEVGAYSQRGVCGVYATPELAMAEYPHGTWVYQPWTHDGREMREWSNDYGDTAGVTEYEVEGQ